MKMKFIKRKLKKMMVPTLAMISGPTPVIVIVVGLLLTGCDCLCGGSNEDRTVQISNVKCYTPEGRILFKDVESSDVNDRGTRVNLRGSKEAIDRYDFGPNIPCYRFRETITHAERTALRERDIFTFYEEDIKAMEEEELLRRAQKENSGESTKESSAEDILKRMKEDHKSSLQAMENIIKRYQGESDGDM